MSYKPKLKQAVQKKARKYISKHINTGNTDKTPNRVPTQLGIYNGLTGVQAQILVKELSELDVLLKPNFKVTLAPYFANSAIANTHIKLLDGLHNALATGNLSVNDRSVPIPIFPQNSQYGQYIQYLATDIDVSFLDAQTDSQIIGAFNINHVTGNSTGDVTITFIETRNAMIANSAKAIKNIMFNKDGTQAPPKDYLMKMRVEAIDRHNHLPVFEQEWIVSLQTGSIGFSSSEVSTATTQLTFTKMFPMLK